MKRIIMAILLITVGISAKTITGTINWAQMEEGVIPMISIQSKGKEFYLGYEGKENIDKVDKKKGQKVRAFINKDNDVYKLEYISSNKK